MGLSELADGCGIFVWVDVIDGEGSCVNVLSVFCILVAVRDGEEVIGDAFFGG